MPGRSVAQAARRYPVNANLTFKWLAGWVTNCVSAIRTNTCTSPKSMSSPIPQHCATDKKTILNPPKAQPVTPPLPPRRQSRGGTIWEIVRCGIFLPEAKNIIARFLGHTILNTNPHKARLDQKYQKAERHAQYPKPTRP